MSERYKYSGLIEELAASEDPGQLSAAFSMVEECMNWNSVEVVGRGGDCMRIRDEESMETALHLADILKERCLDLLVDPDTACREIETVYWNCLLMRAPYRFDDFCLYMERNREPRKRFYEPRRKQLLPIVQALQRLEEEKIDLLAISLPPGVGKTTLAIFYVCWSSGRNPEMQSLIGSHNNEFLRGVYDESLRFLQTDGEYTYSEIFPKAGVVGTNAKDLRIDLSTRKRFQTIELTSLGSGNAGKVRATKLLYCDDLCEGIEQAMSRDQMEKLWQKYSVDLRQRKQGDKVRELHIQTRWSVNDVVGRLQGLYADSDRAEFINIPALDDDGQSRFDYPYGLGFSTEMYEDLRNSMDDASWRALYLGQPIEREGQLYAPSELRRYFELPESEPDAILAVCDTKEQGQDYCVMPIVYQYGTDYYVDGFICDNGKPEIIRDRIVNAICERGIQLARFESNRGGSIFAQGINERIKERGSHCKITTKWNEQHKETRIFVASDWVKEHCLFKDESLYSREQKEYRTAMNFLTSYSMTGGSKANKHDDVPDAMAELESFVRSFIFNRVEVRSRTYF